MKNKQDKRPVVYTRVSLIDLETLVYGAFNYALGRRTYIVQETVQVLMTYIDEMPEKLLRIMAIRIEEAITNNQAGMDMDVKEWTDLLGVIQVVELLRRQGTP